VRSFYACVSQAALLAGPNAEIPLSATAIQVLQLLISATLICLFLLAVKNRYKVK
jgi:hypothetical protein